MAEPGFSAPDLTTSLRFDTLVLIYIRQHISVHRTMLESHPNSGVDWCQRRGDRGAIRGASPTNHSDTDPRHSIFGFAAATGGLNAAMCGARTPVLLHQPGEDLSGRIGQDRIRDSARPSLIAAMDTDLAAQRRQLRVVADLAFGQDDTHGHFSTIEGQADLRRQ